MEIEIIPLVGKGPIQRTDQIQLYKLLVVVLWGNNIHNPTTNIKNEKNYEDSIHMDVAIMGKAIG